MSENIDRRDFLKRAGAGALAIGTASLTGCSSRPSGSAEGSAGMETREAPKNGGKVSLLGYGCMRWPMKKGDDGKDYIDQEAGTASIIMIRRRLICRASQRLPQVWR